ncbi:DUF998 domain-containing protein [Halovivax limisalsi]|uniref:DUF998 domain-containing protein n=1 Tax=Halovivax limisalsi TaxID=1453760 RepID=UPI001FFD2B2F|nr:DUF998 domain-containing protein [Halovivax limisalsi]
MGSYWRLQTACGAIAAALVIGVILVSSWLAEPSTFAWRHRALSDMGRADARTFALFNGGLAGAGVLGIGFVPRVQDLSQNRLQRLGAIALAGSLAGLAGAGVFFLDHSRVYLPIDLHAPAAIATFTLAPVAAIGFGVGAWEADQRRLAAGSILAGAIPVASWLLWLAGAVRGARDWFSVPELVATVSLAAWLALLVDRSRRSGPTGE